MVRWLALVALVALAFGCADSSSSDADDPLVGQWLHGEVASFSADHDYTLPSGTRTERGTWSRTGTQLTLDCREGCPGPPCSTCLAENPRTIDVRVDATFLMLRGYAGSETVTAGAQWTHSLVAASEGECTTRRITTTIRLVDATTAEHSLEDVCSPVDTGDPSILRGSWTAWHSGLQIDIGGGPATYYLMNGAISSERWLRVD